MPLNIVTVGTAGSCAIYGSCLLQGELSNILADIFVDSQSLCWSLHQLSVCQELVMTDQPGGILLLAEGWSSFGQYIDGLSLQ